MLPERAGQPVKVWVHIPLAELLEMDGSTTLVRQWVTAMRAAWAAHRAAASEGGVEQGPHEGAAQPRTARPSGVNTGHSQAQAPDDASPGTKGLRRHPVLSGACETASSGACEVAEISAGRGEARNGAGRRGGSWRD